MEPAAFSNSLRWKKAQRLRALRPWSKRTGMGAPLHGKRLTDFLMTEALITTYGLTKTLPSLLRSPSIANACCASSNECSMYATGYNDLLANCSNNAPAAASASCL